MRYPSSRLVKIDEKPEIFDIGEKSTFVFVFGYPLSIRLVKIDDRPQILDIGGESTFENLDFVDFSGTHRREIDVAALASSTSSDFFKN